MKQQQILISESPLCKQHNNQVKYYCEQEECKLKILGCGDCIFEQHIEHYTDVKKISSVIEGFNQKCIDMKLVCQDKQPDSDGIDKIIPKIQDPFFQKIQSVFKQQLVQTDLLLNQCQNNLKELTLLFRDPSYQIKQLNLFFKSENKKNYDFFVSKMQNLSFLNDYLQKYIKSDQPKINKLEVNTEKLDQDLEQIIKEFKHESNKNRKEALANIRNVIKNNLAIVKVDVLIPQWDLSNSNEVIIEEGKIKGISNNCSKKRYILSSKQLPQDRMSYMELVKNHNQGCYDSLGVCTSKLEGVRNGDDLNGWAVRLYGKHHSPQFTGAVHNNINTPFFHSWTPNATLAILYNPFNQTLSYFQNQIYLGTPFINLPNKLFICLEICHKGYYQNSQSPQVPIEDELIQAV